MRLDLEKLRQAMHDVATKRGPFALFGLFLRDEAPDKWDLVVSAPWLGKGKLKALGEFVEDLSHTFSEEQLLSLSRIVTLNEDDPILDAIISAVRVEDGSVEIRDCSFLGLKIKRAYVFRAVRPGT